MSSDLPESESSEQAATATPGKAVRTLSGFLESEGFLSEQAAAAVLGKTVRTLAGWRQQRVGPAYTVLGKKGADGKRNGEIIYHRSWLRDYLLANKTVPVRSHESGAAAAGDNQDDVRPPLKRKSKRRERRSPGAGAA
jgi:hypothetical protein